MYIYIYINKYIYIYAQVFAGDHEVTQAQWRRGITAVPLDLRFDDVLHNILTPQGFIHICHMTLCTIDGGSHNEAPVCSSWTFMNRGTSGRSASKPLGDTSRQYVREANCMVSRATLIAYLCAAMGLWILHEQPRGSLYEFHPRWQQFVGIVKVWRHAIAMRDFGAHSDKPTWLYSNKAFLLELGRHALPEWKRYQGPKVDLATTYIDANGKKKCFGNANLKASQSYPRGFGNAIARKTRTPCR